MKSRFLIIVIALLFSSATYAQTEFYLELDATYSFIPEVKQSMELTDIIGWGIPSTVDVIESYEVTPGFYIGGGLSKGLSDRVSINAGLGILYNQFKRDSRVEGSNSQSIDDPSLPTVGEGFPQLGSQPFILDSLFSMFAGGAGDDLGKTRILYLSIPVKMQYAVIPKKFNVALGLTNYFMAYSSQMENFYTGTLGLRQPLTMTAYKNKSGDGLSNYQLSGDLSLEYNINKGFWIQTSYSHGFLSIYDKPQQEASSQPSAKYRTVAFGLKYIL